MNIKKFDCVGIFGESGVGKTTLVDIIMGLYKPDKGHLLIDEKKIVKHKMRYKVGKKKYPMFLNQYSYSMEVLKIMFLLNLIII